MYLLGPLTCDRQQSSAPSLHDAIIAVWRDLTTGLQPVSYGRSDLTLLRPADITADLLEQRDRRVIIDSRIHSSRRPRLQLSYPAALYVNTAGDAYSRIFTPFLDKYRALW